MLQVRIHGIQDGKFNFELEEPVLNLAELPEEFVGNIKVFGSLTKIGKRYSVICNVTCIAKLICDVTLEEFEEEIKANFELNIIANSELYYLNEENDIKENESGDIIIHEDDQFVVLTDFVRQELILGTPMKKVSPKYRDKDFDEIYPELSSEKNQEINEQWSALKKLKVKS
jgi:uncharacterized metal-binding protein YceD (DUF177 family)